MDLDTGWDVAGKEAEDISRGNLTHPFSPKNP
jgi:hypothetical protein